MAVVVVVVGLLAAIVNGCQHEPIGHKIRERMDTIGNQRSRADKKTNGDFDNAQQTVQPSADIGYALSLLAI